MNKTSRIVIGIVIGIIAATVLACISFFMFNEWFNYSRIAMLFCGVQIPTINNSCVDNLVDIWGKLTVLICFASPVVGVITFGATFFLFPKGKPTSANDTSL